MKNIYLLLLSSLFPFALSAQCVSSPSNVTTFTYNGNTYQVIKENKTWADAAACAVAKGGYLAEIDSQTEQDSVYFNVNQAGINPANTVAADGGQASYLWLGGNDLETEGEWKWDGNNDGNGTQFWQGTTTGGPVGGLYNNWGNEPDNFQNQDALGLAITDWPRGDAGQWNDLKAADELYYVVEYDGLLAKEDAQPQPQLHVSPNPAQSSISLEIPRTFRSAKGCHIQLFSSNGQLLIDQHTLSTQASVDVESLPNGMYHLQLTGKSGQRTSSSVMIAR